MTDDEKDQAANTLLSSLAMLLRDNDSVTGRDIKDILDMVENKVLASLLEHMG